jgi:hypothetical protein
MQTRNIALIGALSITAVALLSASGLARQPADEAPAQAPRVQSLTADLQSNIERQERQYARAKLMAERGFGDADTLTFDALQQIATARELLFRVSGEGRDELAQIRAQIVAQLERMMATAQRSLESGIATENELAELSNKLAAAKVALYELTAR